MLNHGYKKDLDDLYVYKELDKNNEVPSLNFAEVNKNNLNLFIQVSTECFPDFPNNTEYCEFCYKISSAVKDKRNLNIVLMIDNKVAAFGSVLVSSELKIAYLHNLGTLGQFRRKGYFEALVKYLSNFAFQNGATIICANVEDGGASHSGFTKLGYKKDSKFYHFTKI
ncbi:MAG: GNAT family N-acetyltransferase [Patescibacteria group bacterium]